MGFDIRRDVAEVPRSEPEEGEESPYVDFTFEIKLAKRLKDARGAKDLDEGLVASLEAQVAEASYRAELRSVPRRRREDIYQAALDAVPAKPTMFGQDEKANYLRGIFVRKEIVIAAVKSIRNPAGEVNDTEELVRATIEYIHDEAPDQIFETIERAVQKINDVEDAQDALHKSTDF